MKEKNVSPHHLSQVYSRLSLTRDYSVVCMFPGLSFCSYTVYFSLCIFKNKDGIILYTRFLSHTKECSMSTDCFL